MVGGFEGVVGPVFLGFGVNDFEITARFAIVFEASCQSDGFLVLFGFSLQGSGNGSFAEDFGDLVFDRHGAVQFGKLLPFFDQIKELRTVQFPTQLLDGFPVGFGAQLLGGLSGKILGGGFAVIFSPLLEVQGVIVQVRRTGRTLFKSQFLQGFVFWRDRGLCGLLPEKQVGPCNPGHDGRDRLCG